MKGKKPVSGNRGKSSGIGKGNSPNSRANLKMFPPGVSGNPSGRPKGSISKYYNEVLERVDPKTGKQRALKVAEAHIDACEANPSFANIVLDRTEGSVVQKHSHELEGIVEILERGKAYAKKMMKEK